uniref:CTD nuclear envelope phosphatase 1 n=1 Tax=Lonchura striata TaxID=40157 RepID=UPI000B4CAA30|nr:CTD nuclear envelope phosphatase 1 [Lonchura striata domestica]
MMRSQCLLGLRSFVAFAAKLWSFALYLLRRQARTVIQYQTVRYDVLPLSPISRNRLNQVKRKILVLDLDETLIHSHHDGVLRPTVRPGTPPDFILKVPKPPKIPSNHPEILGIFPKFHGFPPKFPNFPQVSQWYELVVFTASMEIYGCAVADKLDNNRSILNRRYYRQHCTLELGSYIKDLSVVHSDLSSIVILDNSPGAYRSHPGWDYPHYFLEFGGITPIVIFWNLGFTADVRSVLSRNLHQHRLW